MFQVIMIANGRQKEHHRRWKPSTHSTKLKNQQQQEKIESILFFFAERKQKVAVNFKDI